METAIRRLSGGGKQFETGCRSADGCRQEESFAKEQKPLFGKVSLHEDMNIRGKAAAVAGILDCESVFRYVYREAGEKDACFFVSWLVALADEKAEIRTVKEHLSAVVQTSRNSYDKTPEREHLLDLLKS